MYNKKIFKRIFCYPKRYWYHNIKMIPRYFKEIHHLIKYGYDTIAVWDTFCWFIDSMRDILNEYKLGHEGHPILDVNISSEENNKQWMKIIDRMLLLLDYMDVDNPNYDDMNWRESDAEMLKAKDEFFQLFSKYFYHLWD